MNSSQYLIHGLISTCLVLTSAVTSAADPGVIQSRTIAHGTDLVLLEDHRAPLVYLVIELPLGIVTGGLRGIVGAAVGAL